MGVPRGTSASIEIPADLGVAWRALMAAAGSADEPTVWHLAHTDVLLDTVSPEEAAGGFGSWKGVDYRVSAHLVPRGSHQTLVVLTAEAEVEPEGITRAASSHRQARRDLESLAAAVGRQVTDGPSAD